jgi:mediator of RNA polymerase II transcription subunit 7
VDSPVPSSPLMAEQPQSNVSAAAFPSPPPFYQYFTIENVNRIAAFRAAQQTGSSSASPGVLASQSQVSSNPALRLLDLPPELRFLHPPEPPAEGIYRSFGDMFNVR